MNITILVPQDWLGQFGVPAHLRNQAQECTQVVREILVKTLDAPLPAEALGQPTPEAGGPNLRLLVSMPARTASTLSAHAQAHGLTPGPMAKRLLGLVAQGVLGQIDAGQGDTAVPLDHPLSKLNVVMGDGLRAAQAQVYDNIWDSLTSASIGLVEGGTGIGKTRAMVAAALRQVQEKRMNVGICAPSIAILRQHAREYVEQAKHLPDIAPVRLIVGRREYVSEAALANFLQTPIGAQWDLAAVRLWLAQGRSPKAQDEDAVDIAWQVYDLLQIAPDLPVDEVRLDEQCLQSDRGYMAYRAQFAKGDDENPMAPTLLLFTSAMLAQDMRRKLQLAGQDEAYKAMQEFYYTALRQLKGKKHADTLSEREAVNILESELGVALHSAVGDGGILPAFTCLLVDEGHTLEESISQSLSDYLSLRAVIGHMKDFVKAGGTLPSGTIDQAGECLQSLISAAPSVDKREFMALSSDGDFKVIPQLLRIAQFCETAAKPRDAQSERFASYLQLRRAAILINTAVHSQRQYSFLRHSPVKQLPQLFVSNASARTVLSRLWSTLESAAVVSATLYLLTSDGPSSAFMASLLQIPTGRLRTYPPVHANWSYQCVREVMLARSHTQWMVPPSLKDPGLRRDRTPAEFEACNDQWHADLATEVRKIWGSAAGGVLVLCTSYQTVQALRDLLKKEDGPMARSIVAASPGLSLTSQGKAFLTLSHDHEKPLWLALGAAWTGLDIGGHDPWRNLFGEPVAADKDNVLTDLVIPRLPFRTNQSLSHLLRIRTAPNSPWDLWDASLRVKQALGRLVRRAGLPSNRRIWVLDARLSDPQRAPSLTPITRSLAKYKQLPFTQYDASGRPTNSY